MATIDDVEVAIQQAAAGFLFPGTAYLAGDVQPASVPASSGYGAATVPVQIRLYVGAPSEANLNADMRAGITNVCVFREKGMSRNRTRFAPYRRTVSNATPTISAVTNGGGFLVSGAAGAGNVIAALVAGVWYGLAPAATDGPSAIATALAAAIPGAAAVGGQVNVAAVSTVSVGVTQWIAEITAQIEEVVNVAILAAPTNDLSGPLVRTGVDRLLSGLMALRDANGRLTRFLPLPDGTSVKVLMHDAIDDDTTRRENLWRRWIGLRCEYDVATLTQAPPLLAPLLGAAWNGGPVQWVGPGAPFSPA